MENPSDGVLDSIDVDIDTQEILLVASQHDIPKLRQLIRSNEKPENPVNVKDPETGYTPLHAAISACEPEDAGQEKQETTNGVETASGESPTEEKTVLESGRDMVKFLLQEGAIWNDLDANDETPGCLARRLGVDELYQLMVDAGVRAEMLLNLLEGYEPLEGSDEEDGGVNVDEEETAPSQPQDRPVEGQGTASETQDAETAEEQNVTSDQYLNSHLTFQDSRILDNDRNGVMMSWETKIMEKSAKALLPTSGLRVLNIGHGMGIVDDIFQGLEPIIHHIVEAHPAVIADMKAKGWHEKPGVVIHEGKWQEILPKLVDQGEMFDAIYYDTFAESYSDFRDFFSEQVIGLLDPDGKWSFFNGMGADRQISYDVYQKVVEMDLLEAGFDIEWEEIKVPSLDEEWDGVRRKYWVVESYRLPICRYLD